MFFACAEGIMARKCSYLPEIDAGGRPETGILLGVALWQLHNKHNIIAILISDNANKTSVYYYRTLVKEAPWAVHLTLGQDWGMGRYSRYHVTFIRERAPR